MSKTSSGVPPAFARPLLARLQQRLRQPRLFLQVLSGPRQAGKTTLALQAAQAFGSRAHYATADEPSLRDRAWIEQQWETGRHQVRGGSGPALLVLDEVQKVTAWSDTVKRLWDEDTRAGLALHVVILGSAPLLMQRGLADSLAGRFEVLAVPHWSYAEMRDAFGWKLDEFVYYGGYPGSAPLIAEPERWRRYILDALVETTVSRDVLLLSRVDKPALLRRLFELGCRYSGQVLSYTKMLGQLQDAGNVTTLAHYLDLLRGAGLLEGLHKHAGQRVRQRGSSPKLQVHNTALISAHGALPFAAARRDPPTWGRLVESAVGAHLVSACLDTGMQVGYWAAANREVDFVLVRHGQAVAIEVKTTGKGVPLPGMAAFARQFETHRQLLVGGDGIPLEDFLTTHPAELF